MKNYNCPICGVSNNEPLYINLKDNLFGSLIPTDLVKCSFLGCSHIFAAKKFTDKEISNMYLNYYTHETVKNSKLVSIKKKIFDKCMHLFLTSQRIGQVNLIKHFCSKLFVNLALAPIPWMKSYFLSNSFYLRDLKNIKILEFGCGDGSNLRRFKERGFDTYAIDFDTAAIQCAAKIGINGKVGSYTKAKEFNEKFDVIVLRHVVEHLPDVVDCLNHLKKELKPGGKIVIITPNANSIGHKIYTEHWRGLEPPRHLNIFNISSLGNVLKKVNLSNDNVFTYPSLGYSIAFQSLRVKGKFKSAFVIKIVSIFMAYYFQLRYLVDGSSGEELIAIAELSAS